MATILTLTATAAARADGYDPLRVDGSSRPAHLDVTAHDAARNRDIPLRIYLPATAGPAPVVFFSHGLGGARTSSPFFGEHWAARGYVAVFLQHPGSDDAVWKDVAPKERLNAMKDAASVENLLERVQDVPAVLNQLEAWNADKTNALHGRLDMKEVGMSGHSFGAVTTEAVSGETMPMNGQEFTDSRIKAAIAFSPSPPHTITPEEAFGSVKIPWMLMTGTKDSSPIGVTDPESRLKVYAALKGAPKFELVLFNAEHSVFTERVLPGDKMPRNPNHRRVILALTTAFWDAYLRHAAAALAWLKGPGPRSIMEPNDKWQFSAP